MTSISADPSRRLSELDWIPAAEREQVVTRWNATRATFPASCVHELFEAQAARHPTRTALVCDDEAVSYAALDARANQVARRLRQAGVAPETRVGLCLERSAALVVGLLGILKAGGAYVPLDPAYPPARLHGMLTDAAAHVIVTQRRWTGLFADARVICLDDEEADGSDAPPVGREVTPRHLAYVMYTSGSTGQPKGVAIEHRQLTNYVHALIARVGLAAGAQYGWLSTVAADLGNTVLFAALCGGGTLHVLGDAQAWDGAAWASYNRRHRLDCVKITPTHLKHLVGTPPLADGLPARHLILGGEAADAAWVAELRAARPDCQIVNHYGPTECAVGVTTYAVPAAPLPAGGRVPIGRPLGNVQAYVLDSSQRPLPIGVVGELYLGGAQVARGYLGQPAATAARFVPDPFSQTPGHRLYRTGDRVRWQADGTLAFLGRVDHQIKLRGFRIELGEIEMIAAAAPCRARVRGHPARRYAGAGAARRLCRGRRYRRTFDIGLADVRRLAPAGSHGARDRGLSARAPAAG